MTIEAPSITTAAGGVITRELREIALHDLTLDPVINRTVDEKWVAKLAEEFNPYALGLLTVWETADGDHKIVDGQHRYRAAQTVGFDEPVACYVHHGLTEAEAAELFLAINSQRNVSAIDKFRKAVQANHPKEVAVASILADYELVVGTAIGDVGSPGALMSVYNYGGEPLLRRFIDTLTGAFSDNSKASALHGEVLAALLFALKKYGRVDAKAGEPKDQPRAYALDLDHLQRKLEAVSLDELFANRDAKHRDTPRYTKRWHLAGALVEEYNRGENRSRKLEAWTYRAA